jgi:hypothetical protein
MMASIEKDDGSQNSVQSEQSELAGDFDQFEVISDQEIDFQAVYNPFEVNFPNYDLKEDIKRVDDLPLVPADVNLFTEIVHSNQSIVHSPQKKDHENGYSEDSNDFDDGNSEKSKLDHIDPGWCSSDI